MSRKAIKAINWAALAERIPETEKSAFAAFKAKSDQYLQRSVNMYIMFLKIVIRELLYNAIGIFLIFNENYGIESGYYNINIVGLYCFHICRMTANPEVPPKIDWAYYKKNVPLAGLVDKFQKEYESFTIPYPTDKYTSQLESQEKELVIIVTAKCYICHFF